MNLTLSKFRDYVTRRSPGETENSLHPQQNEAENIQKSLRKVNQGGGAAFSHQPHGGHFCSCVRWVVLTSLLEISTHMHLSGGVAFQVLTGMSLVPPPHHRLYSSLPQAEYDLLLPTHTTTQFLFFSSCHLPLD